ncbi:MAG: carboxypeptidase-like regulatory domain-containing protein [Ignavibacteriales bacterium]|nr:carboxypeptidase-like regulatory domain-containing protein [Ignavibacteriales bacterium]
MKCSIRAILTLLFLLQSFSFAQQTPRGKIFGKIVDSETGEVVMGANVVVEGTPRGAASDIEGKFVISNIDPGTYALVVSSISYAKEKITNVRVDEGAPASVDVTLTPEAVQGEEGCLEPKHIRILVIPGPSCPLSRLYLVERRAPSELLRIHAAIVKDISLQALGASRGFFVCKDFQQTNC